MMLLKMCLACIMGIFEHKLDISREVNLYLESIGGFF